MSVDIKHRRNIVKYKKGEIPKIYDSALTCFETLSYTYDDKGRILKEVNSYGSFVSYEYDALSKCVSTIVNIKITSSWNKSDNKNRKISI